MLGDKFLARYKDYWVIDPDTGCRIWTGATAGSNKKRPVFTHWDGRLRGVVRYLCEQKYGNIDGLQVRHLCINPDYRCIELDHVIVGNQSQNMMDKTPEERMRLSMIANPRKGYDLGRQDYSD